MSFSCQALKIDWLKILKEIGFELWVVCHQRNMSKTWTEKQREREGSISSKRLKHEASVHKRSWVAGNMDRLVTAQFGAREAGRGDAHWKCWQLIIPTFWIYQFYYTYLIAISSPNCVQIWKGRDRKTVFWRVRHKKMLS